MVERLRKVKMVSREKENHFPQAAKKQSPEGRLKRKSLLVASPDRSPAIDRPKVGFGSSCSTSRLPTAADECKIRVTNKRNAGSKSPITTRRVQTEKSPKSQAKLRAKSQLGLARVKLTDDNEIARKV